MAVVPTYLFMPAKQHTHRMALPFSTPNPAPDLREARLLRRDVLRLRSCRWSTLRHALVQILHERVAELCAGGRRVEALEQGRHFGLADRL